MFYHVLCDKPYFMALILLLADLFLGRFYHLVFLLILQSERSVMTSHPLLDFSR